MNYSKQILLVLILTLFQFFLVGQDITLNLDNVPPDIMCDEAWTEQGLNLTFVNTTADDCTTGSCFFGVGTGSVWLYPSRLTVDLSNLLAIQRVEIDVIDYCSVDCTRASIINGTSSVVVSEGNTTTSYIETLVLENPSEGYLNELAVSSCEGEILEIRICQNSALPVEWSSIATSVIDDAIEILWSTALEVDNTGFAIERSLDGVNFVTIGRVAPNDDGDYKYVDRSVFANQQYLYRIRQFDVTGLSSLSPLVSGIVIQENMNESLKLYPNPTTGKIFLDGLGFSNLTQVSLMNVQGDVITLPQKVTLLDMADLPNGVYLVKIVIGREVIHKRVVKK